MIRHEDGNPIRRIKGTATKGLHRTSWDLRIEAPDPISLSRPAFQPPWAGESQGPLVAPGTYSVELMMIYQGTFTSLGKAQSFELKPVPGTDIELDFKEVADFQHKTSELIRQTSSAGRRLGEVGERLRYLNVAIQKTPAATQADYQSLAELKKNLASLELKLWGDPIRRRKDEATIPGISSRVGQVAYGHWNTRQMPTEVFTKNLELAQEAFISFKSTFSDFLEDLERFERKLAEKGAPYTKGRRE